jgi:predicted ATPase
LQKRLSFTSFAHREQELLILALKEWTQVYGPLVVLLENFDRADALSWSLLSRCAEEIDMPVMVIVAVRPNDGIFATPPLEQVGDTVRCWH